MYRDVEKLDEEAIIEIKAEEVEEKKTTTKKKK